MRRLFLVVPIVALTARALPAQRSDPAGDARFATVPSQSATQSSASSGNLIEIGLDGDIEYVSSSATTRSPARSDTRILLPVGVFRVGFFISPQLSIEPFASVGYFSSSCSGCGSETHYVLGAGALYHFSDDRRTNQLYVRPFAQLESYSSGGSSETANSFGAGLGVKIPLLDRLSTRLEVGAARTLEHGVNPAENRIIGSFGLSFFTR